MSHWVSELLTLDCKFGCTSQYIFDIMLALRCIRLYDAHWRIRTPPVVITSMTKLTRYHLLQLEGSSNTDYIAGLWCAERYQRGPHKCHVAWYENPAVSASARHNPRSRHATAFDSLETLSYQKLDWIVNHKSVTVSEFMQLDYASIGV